MPNQSIGIDQAINAQIVQRLRPPSSMKKDLVYRAMWDLVAWGRWPCEAYLVSLSWWGRGAWSLWWRHTERQGGGRGKLPGEKGGTRMSAKMLRKTRIKDGTHTGDIKHIAWGLVWKPRHSLIRAAPSLRRWCCAPSAELRMSVVPEENLAAGPLGNPQYTGWFGGRCPPPSMWIEAMARPPAETPRPENPWKSWSVIHTYTLNFSRNCQQ